jgi:hypothetical protein
MRPNRPSVSPSSPEELDAFLSETAPDATCEFHLSIGPSTPQFASSIERLDLDGPFDGAVYRFVHADGHGETNVAAEFVDRVAVVDHPQQNEELCETSTDAKRAMEETTGGRT